MKIIRIQQENRKVCYIQQDKIISVEETDNGKTWINTMAVDRGGITRAYVADEHPSKFIARLDSSHA